MWTPINGIRSRPQLVGPTWSIINSDDSGLMSRELHREVVYRRILCLNAVCISIYTARYCSHSHNRCNEHLKAVPGSPKQQLLLTCCWVSSFRPEPDLVQSGHVFLGPSTTHRRTVETRVRDQAGERVHCHRRPQGKPSEHCCSITVMICFCSQKHVLEHEHDDNLLMGSHSQKANPFREKSPCVVI